MVCIYSCQSRGGSLYEELDPGADRMISLTAWGTLDLHEALALVAFFNIYTIRALMHSAVGRNRGGTHAFQIDDVVNPECVHFERETAGFEWTQYRDVAGYHSEDLISLPTVGFRGAWEPTDRPLPQMS